MGDVALHIDEFKLNIIDWNTSNVSDGSHFSPLVAAALSYPLCNDFWYWNFVFIFAFTFSAITDMVKAYSPYDWRYTVYYETNHISAYYDYEIVYDEMIARALLPSEFSNRCYTNDVEICARYERNFRGMRYPWTDFWYNLLGSTLGGITTMILFVLLTRPGKQKKKRSLGWFNRSRKYTETARRPR